MLLGWAFGQFLLERPNATRIRKSLALAFVVALAVFLFVRGENAYGNMRLLREGGSLVQWLHVSKYPPSVSYDTLELGISFLLLAVFYMIPDGALGANNPLLVLGRTPMFFYLLHIPLLVGLGHFLGLRHEGGIGMAMEFAAVAIALLYVPCLAYGRFKRKHPDSLARYI
jgi:uncharacterized membrane protein